MKKNYKVLRAIKVVVVVVVEGAEERVQRGWIETSRKRKIMQVLPRARGDRRPASAGGKWEIAYRYNITFSFCVL